MLLTERQVPGECYRPWGLADEQNRGHQGKVSTEKESHCADPGHLQPAPEYQRIVGYDGDRTMRERVESSPGKGLIDRYDNRPQAHQPQLLSCPAGTEEGKQGAAQQELMFPRTYLRRERHDPGKVTRELRIQAQRFPEFTAVLAAWSRHCVRV